MDYKKIGEFIKEMRLKNNLTQEELGKKIFVTNKTISKWENKKSFPAIDLLKPLADALNISLNELIMGQEIKDKDKESMFTETILKMCKKQKAKKLVTLVINILVMLCTCLITSLMYLYGLNDKVVIVIVIIIFIMMYLATLDSKI